MGKSPQSLLFPAFFCLTIASGCQQNTVVAPLAHPVDSTGNRQKTALPPRVFSSQLTPAAPDTLPFFAWDPVFATALAHQRKFLSRKTTPSSPVSGFQKSEMLKAVDWLESMPFFNMKTLAEQFDFYRLNADAKADKVRVTGYYTPILDARRSKTEVYGFPLLEKKAPSPGENAGGDTAQIRRGAGIAGKALAWVKSEKELANAQLQGSCLAVFPDGDRQFLGFGGSVPYAGEKYVFFTKIDKQVVGAALVPMTAGYSLAIDPKVAPLGSVIFAELPQMDAAGKLVGYTYRIVLAQDRGGAIKSAKKVDLYCGIGRKGLEAARKINQFGRFWVMLPKRK